MSEGEHNDYQNLKAKYLMLKDEIESLRYQMFHADAYMGEFHNWIKSDSVYTLLRFGSKSTTIIDGMDDLYQDLLHLSEQLRSADRADINNRNDAFDQTLP